MKVLHVTEALGGGVLYTLALITREQARDGQKVCVAYAPNRDTPSQDELSRTFDKSVTLTRLSVGERGPIAVLRLTWAIWLLLRTQQPDILHLHSTVAGIAGRPVGVFWHGPVFYTPHGFSFIRRDIPAWKTHILALIERLLGSMGSTLIAVSRSECQYARSIGMRRVTFVCNRIDAAELPAADPAQPHGRRRAVMVGRITAAKAPWRFAAAARRLGDRLEFEWIGSGRAQDLATWLGDSPVAVTGWLGREEVWARLAASDIVLFTSEWEGLPMGLIEAQAIGLAAVASDIPANREIVRTGETGILFKTEAEMIDALELLLDDASLLMEMKSEARSRTRDRFGVDGVADEFSAIYRQQSLRS